MPEVPDVQQWCRTYRLEQEATPRQRQLLLRAGVVALTLVLGYVAYALIAGGGSAELTDLLPALLLWIPYTAFGVLVVRLSPHTAVRADGLWARTDLFVTHEVRWGEVRRIDLPRRFDLYPQAVLADGSRLDLPGVPVAVAEHLRAALAAVRDEPPTPPPPRPERRDDDVEGWDGPFHRG